MSEALFYTDPMQSEFTARVERVEPTKKGYKVILDRTCFYPEGGGQPADRGWLDEEPVLDVQKEGDEIAHLVERQPASKQVRGVLDWHHRFDYMQQHTGQHLISAAFVAIGNYGTVSVRQGAEYTTVDVDSPEIPEDQLEAVEAEAFRVVCENRAVRDYTVSEEEIPSLELRRPPKVSGSIRIVEVEGFDRVACGGVHTPTTGQVGMIKLVDTETIRGTLRTVWKIGTRARDDYREKHHIVRTLVDQFSAKPHELPERTQKLEESYKDTQWQLGKAQERIAGLLAENLLHDAEQVNGHHFVTGSLIEEEKSLPRSLAEELIKHDDTVVCLTNEREGQLQWIIAASKEGAVDFDAVKRDLLPLIDGKGGGKPPVWQGAGRDPSNKHAFIEGVRAHLAGRG
jgi:alanyl-tRNA synthetase